MDQRYTPDWNHNGAHSPESLNGNGSAYQTTNGNYFQSAAYPTYNATASLNRQPSRQFEGYPSYTAGIYAQEDHGARYQHSGMGAPLPPPRSAASTLQPSYPQYDNQTWNYGGANGASAAAGTRSMRGPPAQARRTVLPQDWMPPAASSGLQQVPRQYERPHAQSQRRLSPSISDDELIPTAIVIKNIPFALKKEELTELMTQLGLPLPYAFNYHFDQGVFRGLAFANFTDAHETEQVINILNGYELQNRKLRVEFKKMLPAAERDRIERDKRERRGQLQEQHQPMSTLRNAGSMASMNSLRAPSPANVLVRQPSSTNGSSAAMVDVGDLDLNDPRQLNLYTELLLFKRDETRDSLVFPSDTTAEDRRKIHTLAHNMGLQHRSEGSGDMRQVHVYKSRSRFSPTTNESLSQNQYYGNETQRRSLNRAATIDFSETRALGGEYYPSLRTQGSGLLDIPASPGVNGMGGAQNLRAAKSFADLRSVTPSPALSTASFPVGLTQNIARYASNDYGVMSSIAGATPSLTPTSAERAIDDHDDILSGVARLALGQYGGAPRMNAGPIGSQRPMNGNHDENPRITQAAVQRENAERQPRGPANEWVSGFRRPNGHMSRGSGDSSERAFVSTVARY